MSQPHDRPHERRRLLVLPTGSDQQDRVLALTGWALAFVLLLSMARCSAAAVSTVDAELGAAADRSTAPLGGAGPGGEGAAGAARPRPVRPREAPSTVDGATDTTPGDGAAGGSGEDAVAPPAPPMTFAAPPRQGAPVGGDGAPATTAAPPEGGAGSAAPPQASGGSGALQARLTQLTEATGGWFAPDSTRVAGEAAPVLDQMAAIIRQDATVRVEIGGHTDTNGSAESNLRLSQARADAVRDELVGRGVAADRLVARGYGQSRPRTPNDTVAGRAANRRIELTVLG
jgi:OOP family OmpA-OmpF porin